MTPERLAEIEDAIATVPLHPEQPARWRLGNIAAAEAVRDLCAALRASWARAEAAEASEDALRQAIEAHISVHNVDSVATQSALFAALDRPRTAYGEIAAARREVAEAAKAWQEDELFAHDRLSAAVDALAKAESAQP